KKPRFAPREKITYLSLEAENRLVPPAHLLVRIQAAAALEPNARFPNGPKNAWGLHGNCFKRRPDRRAAAIPNPAQPPARSAAPSGQRPLRGRARFGQGPRPARLADDLSNKRDSRRARSGLGHRSLPGAGTPGPGRPQPGLQGPAH